MRYTFSNTTIFLVGLVCGLVIATTLLTMLELNSPITAYLFPNDGSSDFIENTTEPRCGDGVVSGTEQCESDSDCASGYGCAWCQCYPAEPSSSTDV